VVVVERVMTERPEWAGELLREFGVLLHTEIVGLREEMRGEFAAVREEMGSEFAAVREEMATGIAGLREEMRSEFAAVREDMRSEFGAVRKEMRTGIAGLRDEIRAELADLRSEIAGLSARVAALEQRVGALEERLGGLDTSSTALRVDVMDRMDRLQNSLGAIQEDITVNHAAADRAMRLARGYRDQMNDIENQLASITRLVHTLQVQVRTLRGDA
jgi:chromosome segregation ATPase